MGDFDAFIMDLVTLKPRAIMDLICAVIMARAQYQLPPANELFANPEKHEWYTYEICGACRNRIYGKQIRHIYNMLWICNNCHAYVVMEIIRLENVRKYLNLATLYGKFGE